MLEETNKAAGTRSPIVPYGLLELNASGTVMSYSPADELRSTTPSGDLVGRDLFKEVYSACPAVAGDFKKRFLAFRADGEATEHFFINVPHEQRCVRLQVMLARLSERSEAGRERLTLVRILPATG